jgi:hypothetical protein
VGEVSETDRGAAEVFEAAVEASVGPLLVPGLSKQARMSTAFECCASGL